MEKYIISVDWFQVSCRRVGCQRLEERQMYQGRVGALNGSTMLYQLVKAKEFNPIYEHSLGVALNGFNLATIYFQPRVSSMKPNVCSIKMSNPVLYSANWAFFLVDITSALNWEIRNISRVDVCADFINFANGLDPRTFIERYLSAGAYNPLIPSYYRVGGNRYETIGRKVVISKDITVSGTALLSDYLRFGSRNSGVCVYLYNKSEELKSKGGKLYISDMWKREGLFEDGADVYRLEISITVAGLNVKRVHDAESKNEVRKAISMVANYLKPIDIVALSHNDFMCQSDIETIFWCYASKYFRFKVIGPQKYTHNWPDLQLFDVDFSPKMKPYSISRNLNTGLAERRAADCLKRVLCAFSDLKFVQVASLETAIETLEYVSQIKASEADRKSIEELIQYLSKGYDFDEISKMRLIDTTKLESYKQLISQSLYERLRDILEDSNVARAIDEYEYTQLLLAEQSAHNDDSDYE